jgi:AcrR family transcriptional regulator
MQSALAEVIRLPLLVERLPVPPPPSLDPVLDATEACIARHGLAKTSLSDIARELGVAPSTVYRKVGTVENAALLVMAREGHRLLSAMPELIAGAEGPRVITVFFAKAIEHIAAHPMAAKVLRDEIDWMGRLATSRLQGLLDQAVEATAPLLEAAMDNGTIRRQDPLVLAHWIVRIGGVCLLAPPPGDLVEALDALLLPALEAPPPPKKGKAR